MKRLLYPAIRFFCLFLFLCISHSTVTASENDFQVRGFHIDCRTQVMTMSALYELAEHLSEKGINTILMEYEGAFPFDKHATLCNQYAYRPEQVTDFIEYCAGLNIDVIPLQNCFGHCEYILRHDRYAYLREDKKEVSQVCPLKIEEAKETFREIFREVAEYHPSPYFHIGGDETYLLGNCEHCSAVAQKEGKSRLFVDYIKAMCELVMEMGKRPVIWADVILMYPEAIQELPKELILIDWNYGWEPHGSGKSEILLATGAEVWGATSLRSQPDNLHLTQWKKHFKNLTTFIPFAREKGYKGIIETSWSTSGTYGFHFEPNWEIINMQPIRSAYPMSGFKILIDAYCHSVNDTLALDYDTFIQRYGREEYGLSAKESERLLDYFFLPQEEIIPGGKDRNNVPVDKIRKDCMQLKKKLETIQPKYNQEEFAHYHLMLDLRINYLYFKEIEAIYESPEYNRSRAPELLKRLEVVLKESAQLDKEFAKLNKNYLKEGEIKYILNFRNEKMKTLYEWVKRQDPSTPSRRGQTY